MNVLDEWHQEQSLTQRQTLPQPIIAEYNGRVRADIRLTGRYEDLARTLRRGTSRACCEWKEAFEKYYGASSDLNT